MSDVIQCLRELRQSSQSSVVTGIEESANPDRPTIQHPVEPWLVDLILEQLTKPDGPDLSLIVLSGNSGDGKSYLLREIRERLRIGAGLDPTMVTWLLDATESEHQGQKAVDRLKHFFSGFGDGQDWSRAGLHVVAMNTGTVVRFMATDHVQGEFQQLTDVLGLQLAIRATPETQPVTDDFWSRFDRVLVIDLDRRLLFPLDEAEQSFLDQMLSELDRSNPSNFLAAATTSCARCSFAAKCPVNANLTALESTLVRSRLNLLLRDVTLEDRIHLGPRTLWHLIYQLTVGGLDANALSSHGALPTCDDIGTLSDEDRASSLFFASLFEAPEEGADSGGAALSTELARIDPARRFTIESHETSLSAALSPAEDLRLVNALVRDLGLAPKTLSGSPLNPNTRGTNAVRRSFFLSPDEPDPVRHRWLREWTSALQEHQAGILSGLPTRHESVTLLINVLSELYRSEHNDRLWRLNLPWQNLAQLYGQLTLRPGPQQRSVDPRVTGPDSIRPQGLRLSTTELAARLGAYPLSITFALRHGPEVRVTWPLYRLLRRVSEQQYVAGSLDPERVQHLERIGASLGAQAATTEGVAVLDDDGGLVCEADEAGGYDVISL